MQLDVDYPPFHFRSFANSYGRCRADLAATASTPDVQRRMERGVRGGQRRMGRAARAVAVLAQPVPPVRRAAGRGRCGQH